MSRKSRRRNQAAISDTYEDLEQTLAPRGANTPAIKPIARLRQPKAVADLRRWDPEPKARDAAGRPARIVHKAAAPRPKMEVGRKGKVLQQPSRFAVGPASFRFETGGITPICARRKQRRQVLHALQKTSAGKGKEKKRNRWSEVRC